MDKGAFGEKLAVNYLEKSGYKIIFRNFRTKFAEIDIIAESRNQLVFFEVKYRTNKNFGRAEESVNVSKISKIEKAAKFYIERFYKGNRKSFRIDIIAINNFDTFEIKHYKNITGG